MSIDPRQIEQKQLTGKVAVVTGAARNAGRGIAIELGMAGAIVYCTGRSIRGNPSPLNQPETIEETAEMVTSSGGIGIWVQVDHTAIEEVDALFARVIQEQGKIDLLVNAVSGGGGVETSFLQSSLEIGLQQIVQGGHSHIIATYLAARKMTEAGHGLIISISDQEWDTFYAMQKALINRVALSVADELRPSGVCDYVPSSRCLLSLLQDYDGRRIASRYGAGPVGDRVPYPPPYWPRRGCACVRPQCPSKDWNSGQAARPCLRIWPHGH